MLTMHEESAMPMMRAMRAESFTGYGNLEPVDVPRPRAADGRVLVRVTAAGVTPLDHTILSGGYPRATALSLTPRHLVRHEVLRFDVRIPLVGGPHIRILGWGRSRSEFAGSPRSCARVSSGSGRTV